MLQCGMFLLLGYFKEQKIGLFLSLHFQYVMNYDTLVGSNIFGCFKNCLIIQVQLVGLCSNVPQKEVQAREGFY